MDLLPAHGTWTDQDLAILPKTGGKYELVKGDLVVGPTGFRHDMLIMRLGGLLEAFARKQGLGIVLGPDLGYRMAGGNVRCPDISFIRADRAQRYIEDESDSFFEGAPDLAVEILSPSDDLARTREKASEYLAEGCGLCWILDPESRTVLTIQSDGTERLLAVNDALDGGTVLPGFSVSIAEIFAKPTFRTAGATDD